MNVRTMRRLDRYLGVPACALFTALRRLRPADDGAGGPSVRKILFIKLVEQGTTVLARAAFEAAAARVGREQVYCLTLEENREILDLMGLIPPGNVLAVPGHSPAAAARGLVRAVRAARRAGIDAVVDLEFFARATAVLSWLTGARARAGLHPGPGAGPWRGDLFTHRVLHQPDLHTAQLYEVLVRALDVTPGSLPALPFPPPAAGPWREPFFVPGAEDLRRAAGLVGEPAAGTGARRLFLLNANAGDLEPLRRWPAGRYVELARQLLEEHPGATVLFTGAPAEAAATEALAGLVGSPRCRSVAGRTSLRDLFTLCALCDVLVSNDSGPAHFACLTAARVVVLFGPETPRRFGPLSDRATALSAGLACSPCLSAQNNRRSACRDNLCLQGIGTAEVLAAVRGLLR
jgi:ADP-heptose:LPS heptosyltransferase